MLSAFLFCYPANGVAVPIAEYHTNLQQAIAALDTLVQVDEEESSGDYENRFHETIEVVRTALPEQQPVQAGDDLCSVDNSWLHKALNELKEMAPENRPAKIQQVLEALKAIEERVAEQQQSGNVTDSKDSPKKKLESILARPEYATGAKGPNALSRLIQDFARWLQGLLPKRAPMESGGQSSISFVLQILVVVAALLVLLYVLRILLARFKGSRSHKIPKKREPRIVLGERLEPEETATDLLAEAEALARQGDLRAAIRKGYIALLVELGDRKMISLAQHKTNRDYLSAVSNVPRLHSGLERLTDSFERHWYGFAQATQNDWQDFRASYLATLQTGN